MFVNDTPTTAIYTLSLHDALPISVNFTNSKNFGVSGVKIQLIAVGNKMPSWVTTAFEDYRSRFPKDMPLELIEIPAGKRTKNADIARILDKEEIGRASCRERV